MLVWDKNIRTMVIKCDDCYMANHPYLYGCMSHGDTVGEALQNLQGAKELYLDVMEEEGIKTPREPETTIISESI